MDYALESAKEATGTLSPRNMTARTRLILSKKGLEEELTNVNKALEFLDKYPELEQYTDTLKRVGI